MNSPKMNYQFPKIELSEPERIWLEAVYEQAKQGEDIDLRSLRTKLWPRLPRKFDPSKIDARLLSMGTQITLLGIWHVDPNTDLISKTEKIIECVRDLILAEPKRTEVFASEISAITKIHVNEVAMILKKFLSQLGPFLDGATMMMENGKDIGYSSIRIRDYRFLDQYMKFDGIESLILESFERERLIPTGLQPANAEGSTDSSDRLYFKPNTAFIIMWMADSDRPELEDVHNTIKDVCQSFGIQAVRADDVEHQEEITQVILQHIRESQYLIADLTGERPNVYYEVGYAHSLNKNPILFRQQGTRLHFDLSVHNVPEYRNVTHLKSILQKRFEAILGRSAPTHHND